MLLLWQHVDIMVMCCQSNSTSLFLLFYLCDVGRVAVTDCFKLKVFKIYLS